MTRTPPSPPTGTLAVERVVVDELVVSGWSRRRADRFAAALTAALPAAMDAAIGRVGARHDRRRAASAPGTLHVTLGRADRRDPVRAAATVAEAIAEHVTAGRP
jgi:hypothetical protein